MTQGKCNHSISWKLENGILTLTGSGALTASDYLRLEVPTRGGDTLTLHVLPWSVSEGLRSAGRIGEGTPCGSIPAQSVDRIVINGQITGLREFLSGASISHSYLNLQPTSQLLETLSQTEKQPKKKRP